MKSNQDKDNNTTKYNKYYQLQLPVCQGMLFTNNNKIGEIGINKYIVKFYDVKIYYKYYFRGNK